MRLRVFIVLLTFPSFALAQGPSTDCPGCVLGIFDDQSLTQNFGFWDPATGSPLKTVWVGILYPSDSELGHVQGIELSVDGILDSAFGGPTVTVLDQPVTTPPHSDIRTPDDETNGTGGISVGWTHCIVGSRALIKIDMLSLSPVPNDIVLTVRRKFPPSNPMATSPLLSQCNTPIFTSTTVTGGCYVINPTVEPGEVVGGCTLAEPTSVKSRPWSTIKRLYR